MTIAPTTVTLITALAGGVNQTASTYNATLERVAKTQSRFAVSYRNAETVEERQAIENRARRFLFHAIVDELIPQWVGTPWDFYGTSQTPRQGKIACGYFVSTILRDAGLRVDRIKLAQQASEFIVKTLAAGEKIHRERGGGIPAVLYELAEAGDGLYVVGLDYHTGFLIRRNGATTFCHSSYLGPAVVACTLPDTDPAFASDYFVFGPALSDATIKAWLAGDRIETATH